jgi:hypothetical protein
MKNRKVLRVGKVPKVPRTGRAAKPGHRERVAQRQEKAIALRVAGGTYRAIAAALGVSSMQAHRDVVRSLKESLRLRDGSADELRALELKRLDALLVACWPRAQQGDCESIRCAVRVSERRSKLLGLDAETSSRLELTGEAVVTTDAADRPLGGLSDTQLLVRLDQLRNALAAAVVEPASASLVPPEDPTSLEARAAAYRQELDRRANEWRDRLD